MNNLNVCSASAIYTDGPGLTYRKSSNTIGNMI
jgi:hypothetical protein